MDFVGKVMSLFTSYKSELFFCIKCVLRVPPCSSDDKESSRNPGDLGSIPGSGTPLKKQMATHSSILVWRIPWTEEPGSYSPWDC